MSPVDNAQVVPRPTIIGSRYIDDNVTGIQYHEGESVVFDRKKLLEMLTFVPDKNLKQALVDFENRYAELTFEIRADQMPKVPEFPRPITSRNAHDLMNVNEQFKIAEDMVLPHQRQQIQNKIAKLDNQGKAHIAKLSALYTKLEGIEGDDDAALALRQDVLQEITEVPFDAAEFAVLHIPAGTKPAPAMTARVFKMMCHPIDYLELYRTVFRGKQPVMSKKLLHEVDVMRYAVEHLTDDEFKLVNPHRVALLVWKLMNSADVDDDSVTVALRYIHRMADHEDKPLIHHNPEIMGDSWIVEAFSNRNNPLYSQELIRGAKAADSDLNRFKLFLNDTEKVPRRLGVFLGMHYAKVKRTLPPFAIEPFFHSLNYCRYPGQVNTILNAIVTAAPDLIVPPGAIFEAIVAAHKLEETDTVEALSNYLRHTSGLGPNKVLPMDYRVGSIYIDSLQRRSMKILKQYDSDIETETTAVLKDMIARGQVPHVFGHDIIDAFLIPQASEKTGQAVDVMPLIGGNTDRRFAETSTDNVNSRPNNFHELFVKQQNQDSTLSKHLKTFNINCQSHVLPSVAFTAINYALRTLRNYSNEEGLTFRKPIRIYVPNMKSTYQQWNRETLASDRYNYSATSHEINLDLNGDPIRKVINKRTQQQEPFGVSDLSKLSRDHEDNLILAPHKEDPNEEYKNLHRAMDAADMFDNITDELANGINPHVAHLVEQAIPTLAFNPHIYEDVLDIIHIKTGLSPYGQEKIGGFSGLRNPDKIDDYLAGEIKLLLQSFGLTTTMNKRFGYFEISVNEMNKFVTRNPDFTLRDATVAREQYLQEREQTDPHLDNARWYENIKPTPHDSQDNIEHAVAAQAGLRNPDFYRKQMLRSMKFQGGDNGKPIPDDELADIYYLHDYAYSDAEDQVTKMKNMQLGLPVPGQKIPDVLKNTPIGASKM